MAFYLYGDQVSGITAEAHFVDWCLRLENEHEPVAHCALDAARDFQLGAYRCDESKRALLRRSGIEIR